MPLTAPCDFETKPAWITVGEWRMATMSRCSSLPSLRASFMYCRWLDGARTGR